MKNNARQIEKFTPTRFLVSIFPPIFQSSSGLMRHSEYENRRTRRAARYIPHGRLQGERLPPAEKGYSLNHREGRPELVCLSVRWTMLNLYVQLLSKLYRV